jgi:hypothetical protein
MERHYTLFKVLSLFDISHLNDRIIVNNADVQKIPLSCIICPLLKAQIQSATRNVPMVAGVITRRSANVPKAIWGSTARLLCVTPSA